MWASHKDMVWIGGWGEEGDLRFVSQELAQKFAGIRFGSPFGSSFVAPHLGPLEKWC